MIEIELPTDKSKCSGRGNTNQDHEENQDHLDVSVSTPSTSRSTPAQDKVTAEIDQMTKKIEAHKVSLKAVLLKTERKL